MPADVQSHVLQNHAPKVGDQSIVIHHKGAIPQIVHDSAGTAVRIFIITFLLRTMIVPCSRKMRAVPLQPRLLDAGGV
jgi:hypothetical protein